MVKCKLCATKYNMEKATGSTGNLWNHFRRNLLDQTVSNTIEKFKKEEFNEKLIKWIVDEMYPYTISEEKGFHDIIKYLNPQAHSVTADTVKNKIDEIFDDKKNEVANELRNLNSKPSFTLDAWTSLNMTAN